MAAYVARLDALDPRDSARWAALCAEHVLVWFEREHLADDRPRQAIECARFWARGDRSMMEARRTAIAAHAAARACIKPAAIAAARAAGHAAATAHMKAHAKNAAAYAILAVASASPDGQKSAIEREQAWQIEQF